MYYLIIDWRDNTYYCGLSGWSKLEENAIWYGKDSVHTMDELNEVLQSLTEKEGDHFGTIPRE